MLPIHGKLLFISAILSIVMFIYVPHTTHVGGNYGAGVTYGIVGLSNLKESSEGSTGVDKASISWFLILFQLSIVWSLSLLIISLNYFRKSSRKVVKSFLACISVLLLLIGLYFINIIWTRVNFNFSLAGKKFHSIYVGKVHDCDHGNYSFRTDLKNNLYIRFGEKQQYVPSNLYHDVSSYNTRLEVKVDRDLWCSFIGEAIGEI